MTMFITLYIYSCLYKWLHIHSQSHECPVRKVLIQEEKTIPLYGRGKTQTDPRSKRIPGVDIPHRPVGQRNRTHVFICVKKYLY
ncbi:hypothetical protein Hanom_Chr00s004808g01725301 [Helianthus anomalus]